MKIRYYGFLANKNRHKSIRLIRRLIGIAVEIEPIIKETLQEKIMRITGKDIYLCPECKRGRMICREILLPDGQLAPEQPPSTYYKKPNSRYTCVFFQPKQQK